jgi:hypothetical protein
LGREGSRTMEILLLKLNAWRCRTLLAPTRPRHRRGCADRPPRRDMRAHSRYSIDFSGPISRGCGDPDPLGQPRNIEVRRLLDATEPDRLRHRTSITSSVTTRPRGRVAPVKNGDCCSIRSVRGTSMRRPTLPWLTRRRFGCGRSNWLSMKWHPFGEGLRSVRRPG